MKTNLKGIKKQLWHKNLSGLYSISGKKLTNSQVRTLVEWAIKKGYEYDIDIPEHEVIELLNI